MLEDAIGQLSSLLHEYKECDDHLSKTILLWGMQTLDKANEQLLNRDKDLKKIADELLQELARQILVNPIDRAPLQEPRLERKWTWERWMHAECKNLGVMRSPLDGDLMEDVPKEHFFAKRMLVWMRATQSILGFSQERQVVVMDCLEPLGEADPSVKKMMAIAYQTLGHRVAETQQKQEAKRIAEEGLMRVHDALARYEEISRQVIVKAKEQSLITKRQIQERITSIEGTYSQTIADLQRQIEMIDKAHASDREALENRIAIMDDSREAIVSVLKEDLEKMNLQHHDSVVKLTKQIEEITLSTNHQVLRLTKQLDSIGVSHQESVGGLIRRQEAVVTRLDTDIKGKQAQLGHLQGELAHAHLVSAQHAAAASALRGELEGARADVRHLQWEVENMDDGGSCSIS